MKKILYDTNMKIIDVISEDDLVYLKRNDISFIRANPKIEQPDGFLNNRNNKYYFYNQLQIDHIEILDLLDDDNPIYNFSEIIINFTTLNPKFQNDKENKFFYNDINKLKQKKIEENKKEYQKIINKKYINFNKKKYSISLEDQQAIILLINKIDLGIIQKGYWHDIKNMNTLWSKEQLINLLKAIEIEYQRITNKKENIKEKIYKCKNFQEIQDIKIKYE